MTSRPALPVAAPVVLLGLALAASHGSIDHSVPSTRVMDVSPFLVCAPRATALRRTHCSDWSPLRIEVRARTTPFVEEPLTFEVIAQNGPAPAEYRWSLTAEPGTVDFGGIATEWTESFAPGERKVTMVEGRVTGTLPFHVYARMEPAGERGDRTFPAHGYLALYPFDARGGRIQAHWDPQTRRPLGSPGEASPYITRPDGRRVLTRLHSTRATPVPQGEEFLLGSP